MAVTAFQTVATDLIWCDLPSTVYQWKRIENFD